jgi:hypothetical protein
MIAVDDDGQGLIDEDDTAYGYRLLKARGRLLDDDDVIAFCQ